MSVSFILVCNSWSTSLMMLLVAVVVRSIVGHDDTIILRLITCRYSGRKVLPLVKFKRRNWKCSKICNKINYWWWYTTWAINSVISYYEYYKCKDCVCTEYFEYSKVVLHWETMPRWLSEQSSMFLKPQVCVNYGYLMNKMLLEGLRSSTTFWWCCESSLLLFWSLSTVETEFNIFYVQMYISVFV